MFRDTLYVIFGRKNRHISLKSFMVKQHFANQDNEFSTKENAESFKPRVVQLNHLPIMIQVVKNAESAFRIG